MLRIFESPTYSGDLCDVTSLGELYLKLVVLIEVFVAFVVPIIALHLQTLHLVAKVHKTY